MSSGVMAQVFGFQGTGQLRKRNWSNKPLYQNSARGRLVEYERISIQNVYRFKTPNLVVDL
jgi:hypothetical protein